MAPHQAHDGGLEQLRELALSGARIGLLALVLMGVCAATPERAHALHAENYYTEKTAAQRAAIRNMVANISRGDYTPAPNASVGGTYYPEKAGKVLSDYFKSVPSSAPGAQALHTGTVQVAPKTGMWARFGQSSLGQAFPKNFNVVAKGGGAALGLWALWEVCNATLCKTTPVRVSAQETSATGQRFVFTGATGTCQSTNALGADAPASGVCPDVSHSSTQFGQFNAGPAMHVPPLSLQLMMSNGETEFAGNHCANVASGSVSATAAGDVAGHTTSNTPPLCTNIVPSGGTNTMPWVHGPQSVARIRSYEPVDPNFCGGVSSCKLAQYVRGVRAWHTGEETIAANAAPRDGEPADWVGTTGGRITTQMPTPPADATVGSGLSPWLGRDTAEAQAWRDAIDHVINNLPQPGAAEWTDPNYEAPAAPATGPAYGSFTMPTCRGGTVSSCTEALTSAGHNGGVNVTVLSSSGADLSLPAGAVVSTNPAGGSVVSQTQTVELERNPDVMPLAVPAPNPGETASSYVARLQDLGLVGNVTILTDATMSSQHGPGEVVSVSPAAGSRVAPGSSVSVRTNPDYAPEPGTAPSPLAPPAVSIDMSPLSSQTPCDKFPFGVPCWIVGALGGFSGGSNCPSWDFPLPFFDQTLPVDLCIIQPAVDIFRPIILIAGFLGLGWLFMGAAMGFGGKGGDD